MKMFTLVLAVLAVGAALSFATLSWLNSTDSGEARILSPNEQALKLIQGRGCTACHTLDGSKGIGPTWLGAWGARRTFTDGSSALVDADYLRLAMQNPSAQIVQGFDNLMLPTAFTDAEIILVTDLIKSLQVHSAD